MSGFISQPVLPQYDKAKPPEDNWKELTRAMEAWSNSVVRSCNDAFQRDGSRVLKATSTTLTAGTVEFQDRAMSTVINATFGGGSWKSHDTARPSWALTLDMSLDRGIIRRAAASTGDLTWATVLKRPTPGCHLTNSANQLIATSSYTAVTWNQETRDTDAFHSLTSNTSRITFPFDGWYSIVGALRYAVGTAGTVRHSRIRLGGTTDITYHVCTDSDAVTTTAPSAINYYFTADQYVELMAYHESAAGINVVTSGSFFGAVML